MIIRHLVMTGSIEQDTKPILKWIKDELDQYGSVMVNIMSQYHPDYLVLYDSRYKSINKRVSNPDIQEAYKFAKELNLSFELIS